ncbi:MAG: serine hydrolase domain-containing protein [Streptococcus salivarius]
MTYDLASVSKVVGVGTFCSFYLQAGKLDLDEKLSTYYPEVVDKTLTLRQLLSHSSGIDPFIPNRDDLDQAGLIAAINAIKVKADKPFLYTDINFILLGLMLEKVSGQTLDKLFDSEIFQPFGMSETQFGPVEVAVPTLRGLREGLFMIPRLRLKEHTGSAGLFSTRKIRDFVNHYLTDDFAKNMTQNISQSNKERSVAWDLQGEWILHTGYTGTFVLINIPRQRAAIFLSNRTYYKDERAQWIKDRDVLIEIMKKELIRETVE